MVQATEQECYASSATRPVYLSKLAHRSTQAKSLSSRAEILAKAPVAPCGAGPSGNAAPQEYHISSSDRQKDTGGGSTAKLMGGLYAEIEECMSGSSSLEADALKVVLDKLHSMQEAPVTASLLRDSGIGHKLKALSKGPDRQVAAVAKGVIAAWKKRICKEEG